MGSRDSGILVLLQAAEEVERSEQTERSEGVGRSDEIESVANNQSFSERLTRICEGPSGPHTLAEAAKLTKEMTDRVSACQQVAHLGIRHIYGQI